MRGLSDATWRRARVDVVRLCEAWVPHAALLWIPGKRFATSADRLNDSKTHLHIAGRKASQ